MEVRRREAEDAAIEELRLEEAQIKQDITTTTTTHQDPYPYL